ncbi:MAG: hypothetical protein HC775_15480 [Hyellaceae cyanobacterium CSU_1_1]|nr:hypothetical protein [Hyellaceae cyanobacterium CSU_1_1]
MDTNLNQVELVKDINPGVSDFNPRYQLPRNPDLPYSPPPAQVPNGSFPTSLVEFNDRLYFNADDGENGRELFVSDGTADGTQLVKDIHPGTTDYGYSYSSSPENLVEFNNQIFFSADDGENGNELFVSDGTAEGTQLLVDLYPGENNYGDNGSFPRNLTEFDGKLYFAANDGENGNELFVSDGTAEGTQLLVDLRPGEDNYGNSNGAYPSNLTEFDGKLYFTANDGENGNELFVSDGTAEGTQLLVDLYLGGNQYGSYSSYPSDLVEFNDKLYFSADDGENGRELFVSDGTAEGTQLLVDLAPGESNDGFSNSSAPTNLVEFNDKLYFTADDGENGNELFVTDGTTEGTQLVADINPGIDNYSYPNDSFASSLTVVGDELFFAADNGETGTELFKLTVSDLTESSPIEINGSDRADNLIGGDRNNLLDGGIGDDNLNGGNGEDIFVLRTGAGSDNIFDFNLGSDRFGLGDGLQFDDLNFSGNNILAGGEVIASLAGVNAEQLTYDNFQAI